MTFSFPNVKNRRRQSTENSANQDLFEFNIHESKNGMTQGDVDRMLGRGKHPVLAFISLFAAIVFASIPFAFDTDSALLVLTGGTVGCTIFLANMIGNFVPLAGAANPPRN